MPYDYAMPRVVLVLLGAAAAAVLAIELFDETRYVERFYPTSDGAAAANAAFRLRLSRSLADAQRGSRVARRARATPDDAELDRRAPATISPPSTVGSPPRRLQTVMDLEPCPAAAAAGDAGADAPRGAVSSAIRRRLGAQQASEPTRDDQPNPVDGADGSAGGNSDDERFTGIRGADARQRAGGGQPGGGDERERDPNTGPWNASIAATSPALVWHSKLMM